MLEAACRNAARTRSRFSASDLSVRTKSPRARMRLARRPRPLWVEKKPPDSTRGGGGSYVEYVSPDREPTSGIRLYRWSDAINDWEEIDASAFGEAPSR